MAASNASSSAAEREIVITRVFDAPRDLGRRNAIARSRSFMPSRAGTKPLIALGSSWRRRPDATIYAMTGVLRDWS